MSEHLEISRDPFTKSIMVTDIIRRTEIRASMRAGLFDDAIMVIDTHDPGWTYDNLIDQWATEEGIDTAETWRLEIYQTDGHLHALIYQYARDEQGHVPWNAQGDGPAYLVQHMTLTSMPPIKDVCGWVRDSTVITC